MANKIIWVIDPAQSEITFKVKHMMISNVKGEFHTFSGKMEGEDFTTSKITANIDADSIFTNNQQRDTPFKKCRFLRCGKL
ncbi:YceI family protein [Flavobacterium johnsoniae]|uniref:YceI-like domain-containing protein n=1 Tax=Flavobacterium johnsoniae TaxID=986 RepID=A0A1M5UR05_FLAJO|nr:YceI family protein [Flavobacterium johnsoniae]SHH65467.1 YceI-like domain-containing protein [Flavobacterium johnsoniae]